MDNADATVLADLAVRVGLLTPTQIQEAWDEIGQRGGEPEPWLRALQRKGYLTPFQSGKLLKLDKDGYFLGGYRILYKIASGTFGRVYRADDPRSGRVVAIKVLRKKWSEDKPSLKPNNKQMIEHSIGQFEREGRVGMTLHHPNIVEILAVNRDPVTKQYFIVMEFVEGGNLREIMTSRKKIEPAETLHILEDVTSGLNYALTQGLTHRDMKLTNILISSQKAAKLVDFGLAGVYAKGQQEADDSKVDRSADYAGLEKATNVAAGDTRSDIFFLGCVAYELLTGRSPLDMPKNPRDRMQRERFINIPPLTAAEINGSASVIRLVENMMSLNPHERFQTPSQLLDAIREVRRELEGDSSQESKKTSTPTLFLAEKDERLQDVLRDKLKDLGFRVLIAADPVRAVDRFRQQPFDFFVVDAGTTGENGLHVFERIMNDAQRQHFALHGIIMFSEEQQDWVKKVENRSNVGVLVQPIKLKQLLRMIQELQSAK